MEFIRTTYQKFQTTTTVFKLPGAEHSAINAAVIRTKDSLADIVSVAEDERDSFGHFS